MDDLSDLYSSLTDHLKVLKVRYISPHITAKRKKKTLAVEAYEHDVMAYCVLCHAAIEEFLERTSLAVIERSIQEWRDKKRVTDTLLTLLCYTGEQIKIDDDDLAPDVIAFDRIRKMLANAKQRMSNEIRKNHGISKRYLLRLFVPVAIDITRDANLLNSLDQLSKDRGDFAHKFLGSSTRIVLSPEDAENYVEDCVKLCGDLRDKAISKIGA